MSQRRLIVNADDLGLTEGVNRGIVEAHEHGILRSATLMANGPAFNDAVERARRCPGLDVGCHLVLIGGRAVAPPQGPLPASVPQLLRRLVSGWREADVEREFAAQIEHILESGIRPTHLDTHKHTHVAPPVLRALLRVARRYSIPWVRRPFDLPLRAARGPAGWRARLVQSGLRPLRHRFESALKKHGSRCTDHFAGFQLTGRFHSRQLADLILALPEGLTEFMCHPGRCTPDLAALPTRLTTSRETELEALVSGEVRLAVEASGTELVSFRDLH